jgi:hypothetical protein
MNTSQQTEYMETLKSGAGVEYKDFGGEGFGEFIFGGFLT